MSEQCCKNKSDYDIVYDCEQEPDQLILVCKTHYEEGDDCWNNPSFIKSIRIIKKA